jgi:hypothetical protein
MAGRDLRAKASELDARGPHPFAKKATFAEALPSVKSAAIEVTEQSYSRTWTTNLTEATAREFVDCSNPACYGGGVAVGRILRETVRERKVDSETSALCRGYEGSPKGRKRIRDCMHSFSVRLHLEFHDEPRG